MNDKLLHFLGGAVIALAVSFAAVWLGLTISASALLGVAIATLVGAAKEWVYDKARPQEHTVDRVDFLATTAGGVVGSIVFMVAKGFL